MPGFIQITDTHIVAPGALACGRSDTATALHEAVATINAHLPRLPHLDCAVITGDLTDHGSAEEYKHFLQIMAALELPWLAVPGNHDSREAMRAALSGAPWMPADGPLHWSRNFGAFSLIGLDTLVEGKHHGAICDEGLAFLDEALSAIDDQPAIVATHHPYIPTGILAMDADRLQGGARLMDRLEAHPGQVRMISGHVHRAITAQIGRVTCQIAPATGHAVALDHRAGREAGLTFEPGGVTLYRWITEPHPCLISDRIALGEISGPWPFES